MSIAQNLEHIHSRIAAACRRSQRSAEEVNLMAVCKTFPPDAIREAHSAGQRLFGENRVQEFTSKAVHVADLTNLEIHMIGHLQSNKAKKAVELFHAVDSLDSVKLGNQLNAAARELGKVLPVLIEINTGGEEAKSGLSIDWTELEPVFAAAPSWTNLRVTGLMTVPPFTGDPEGARPYFRQLRELRGEIARRNLPAVSMDTLSMGMSHDFEVAIEEG
ncbi:MAG TPA: YggS family pyridoxal phosphate-dependent enzyme, partial [Terriglobales bacterium]|nr:YggS family pyridoxal phosphate-dependent enzyme [Terriglobales bacterium]